MCVSKYSLIAVKSFDVRSLLFKKSEIEKEPSGERTSEGVISSSGVFALSMSK